VKSFACNHITKSGQKCKHVVTVMSKQCSAGHPINKTFSAKPSGGQTECLLVNTSTELICKTHFSEQWQVAISLGARPSCSLWDPNTMNELIRKGHITNSFILSALAEDDKTDDSVLLALASSPHCPSDVLRKLALPHSAATVWYGEQTAAVRAASNPNLSLHDRALILRDGGCYVRAALCRNPGITEQELIQLSCLRTNLVNKNISRNEKSPLEALENISYSKSPEVQANLLAHPNYHQSGTAKPRERKRPVRRSVM